jgi:hypothetical protein
MADDDVDSYVAWLANQIELFWTSFATQIGVLWSDEQLKSYKVCLSGEDCW